MCANFLEILKILYAFSCFGRRSENFHARPHRLAIPSSCGSIAFYSIGEIRFCDNGRVRVVESGCIRYGLVLARSHRKQHETKV
jgi:hypothetical protein